MKQKIRYLLIAAFLVFTGVIQSSSHAVAAEKGADFSLGNQQQADAAGQFLSTNSYGLKFKNSIAGQLIDVIRLRNFRSRGNLDDFASNNNYISFSYEGSTGLLGFSSGYIFSPENENGFAGDPWSGPGFENYSGSTGETDVYMGVDISHSISLADDFVLGLKAGVIYLEDIYGEHDDGTLSLLFVMPLEIYKSITIMPKLHWSHSMIENKAELDSKILSNKSQDKNSSFFGGLSISFAY